MDIAESELKEQLVLLVQDGYFPVESPEHQLINDSKTLNNFFAKVNRTRKPGIPVPMVDFNKEIVLVACMGSVNSENYPTMTITSETNEEIFVVARVQTDKKPTTVSYYPFCVYKMPKSSKKVILETR